MVFHRGSQSASFVSCFFLKRRSNSWSTTNWLAYATQRLSVALHRTVARESLAALGLVNVSCVVGSA
jgi:hypothetical protein